LLRFKSYRNKNTLTQDIFDNWKNPLHKIKTPKKAEVIQDPVELDNIFSMAKGQTDTFTGIRNKALLLFLLDTGCRASEALSVKLSDLDIVSGRVTIQKGKGKKFRIVFLGTKAKKALKAYIKLRKDGSAWLWIKTDGTKLTYEGLRAILRYSASKTTCKVKPTAHGFRRAFAVNFLRNGGNIYTLATLLGHSDLTMLKKYAKFDTDDLQKSHSAFSPVDNF